MKFLRGSDDGSPPSTGNASGDADVASVDARPEAVTDRPAGASDSAALLVQGELAKLANAFDRLSTSAVQQTRIADQLYEDLQQSRERERGDHLLPLVRALITVLDRAFTLADEHDGPAREVALSLADELGDTLAIVGVERIDADLTTIDPHLQKVVSIDHTLTDAAWREIAPGFQMGQRVVREQRVSAAADRGASAARDGATP